MNDDTLFRILLAVSFLVTITVAGFYRRRAEPVGGKVAAKTALREEGALIYVPLRVLGFVLWLGPLVYVIAPRAFGWAALSLPLWARWLGVGIAALLPVMIIWTQRSLGGNVTKTVVTKAEHHLVTSGPYRWVRHPLYSLGIAYFVALTLISSTWYFAAAIALGAIPLLLRTRKEEAMLLERFGDEYRVYVRSTGRFFPRLIR